LRAHGVGCQVESFGFRVLGYFIMVQGVQHGSTRWSTTLSPKVNLPHAVDVRASCGANVGHVTLHNLGSTKPSYSTELGEDSPSPDES